MKTSIQDVRKSSPAFLQALLQSERLRIRIVIASIAAVFVIRAVRTALLFSHESLYPWLITNLFLAIFALYELLMLRAVNRSIKTGRDLPRSTWIATIIIETCIPALALVAFSGGAIEAAYKPLANPAVLLYFIFIILSTLRLDPNVSRLSGIVAAASYLLAAAYLGWAPRIIGGTSLLTPERAVGGFAISAVVAGFIAGAVAGEIRKQVDAALHEAETKRQVEQLRHDLEVARSIQQSLLPTSAPSIEGFEIAGWNKPADQTGGDYYDWFVRPDGKLLLALGDVTGHGIGPAILAAVCRAYVRATFTPENGLLTAMQRVNAALAQDTGPRRFVTFVAVMCTPGNSRIELLSAGHGPLYVYWLREDRFDAMPAQGLPLGLLPDLGSDPPKILEFNPGDLLVITTDGFFEWANAQEEQFGDERMEATIRASRDKAPAEIISDLYKAVIDFSGGTSQDDDLTAIIIKRT
ncbi:MAG TPA: SpoIIE family protein phosphatase [Silvibacterium sp.]|jgi:serine phosphatase RsbU (regulator of sigma subunit)|nr:SpoIIE family protein phosphatase [Silvibacterium sp.]